MVPLIAIYFSMNLVPDEKCWGQDEKSIGDDFSQTMTPTAVLRTIKRVCPEMQAGQGGRTRCLEKGRKQNRLTTLPNLLTCLFPNILVESGVGVRDILLSRGLSLVTFPFFLLCWASLCKAILGTSALRMQSLLDLYTVITPKDSHGTVVRFLQAACFVLWAISFQQLGTPKGHWGIWKAQRNVDIFQQSFVLCSNAPQHLT